MKITQRREEGITILALDGKLSIGEGDVVLRNQIDRLMSGGGADKVLIDLKHVRVMDSSGLGELVRANARVSETGGRIKLLHVESRVRDILAMTRLIGVFETFEDEIDAIASFRD